MANNHSDWLSVEGDWLSVEGDWQTVCVWQTVLSLIGKQFAYQSSDRQTVDADWLSVETKTDSQTNQLFGKQTNFLTNKKLFD